MFNIGRTVDIWDLKATVNKAMIAQARTEQLIAAATAKGPAAVKAVVPVKEKDVKDEEVKALRKALKDEFVTAEANWDKWKSVP
jgi:hypothetical protein